MSKTVVRLRLTYFAQDVYEKSTSGQTKKSINHSLSPLFQSSCNSVKSAMGLNIYLKWRQAQQDQMASDDLTQFIKVGTHRSYRVRTASA